MLTLEQAKEVIDLIVRQTRMTREEHAIASQAVELLYDGAKEHQETQQTIADYNMTDTNGAE